MTLRSLCNEQKLHVEKLSTSIRVLKFNLYFIHVFEKNVTIIGPTSNAQMELVH
jgi:hypothetical protein